MVLQRLFTAIAGLALVIPGSNALAQESDLASKIVNEPGNPQVTGAAARLVDDSAVQGGKALRIQVPRKGKNPWDSTVGGEVLKPIHAGDKLVLVLQARLEHGDSGSTTTLPYAAVQLAGAPYTTVMSGSGDIGPDWKTLQFSGTADKDYPAKALNVTIQLATARQTVDFGPIVLLDMGK